MEASWALGKVLVDSSQAVQAVPLLQGAADAFAESQSNDQGFYATLLLADALGKAGQKARAAEVRANAVRLGKDLLAGWPSEYRKSFLTLPSTVLRTKNIGVTVNDLESTNP